MLGTDVKVLGDLRVGDDAFKLGLDAGTPSITFDTFDRLAYDRSTNTLSLLIGNGQQLNFAPSVIYSPYNAYLDIGKAEYRVNNLYLANNPNVSSDARLKQVRGAFTDAELDAWEDVEPCVFQYLAAIEEKGEDHARLHAGYIWQDVEAAFAAHGLDASRYGLWGQDPHFEVVTRTETRQRQVEEMVDRPFSEIVVIDGEPVQRTGFRPTPQAKTETKPVRDEATGEIVLTMVTPAQPAVMHGGVEISPARPAIMAPVTYEVPVMEDYEVPVTEEIDTGETRGSLRYEQCAVFAAACERRRAERLTARVAALEAQT